VEAFQTFIYRQMDKQNVYVHAVEYYSTTNYYEVLSIHYNLDKPGKHAK
jgi:hypothetical protein